MVIGWLYKSVVDVYSYVVEVWELFIESDYCQVFEVYLMIGDVNSFRVKFVNIKDIVVLE